MVPQGRGFCSFVVAIPILSLRFDGENDAI
jgi:hypothetical protein